MFIRERLTERRTALQHSFDPMRLNKRARKWIRNAQDFAMEQLFSLKDRLVASLDIAEDAGDTFGSGPDLAKASTVSHPPSQHSAGIIIRHTLADDHAEEDPISVEQADHGNEDYKSKDSPKTLRRRNHLNVTSACLRSSPVLTISRKMN
jgi:hypothetical protein